MSVALIDYDSGNVKSARKALERACPHNDVVLTADPDRVARADHIVLPGVGAFGDCVAGLRAVSGMWEALTHAVREKGRPFLGICVGMQLTCTHGLENGRHDGLGWIDGEVVQIKAGAGLKIPHIGWNNLRVCAPHPILDGLDGVDMYFVHSYVATPATPAAIRAEFDYGGTFAACLAHETIFGTQFHPEKSQQAGLKLLENFLAWRP